MPWASLPQKQLILTLARGKYQGFNDSHLAEKLRAEENLAVSRETVRRLLRAAKLASPQKRRPRQYRSRRPPRPRFGMMVLTDASRHDWLEGRGPELTLIGFQDDATSQILAAHFQLEAENTLGYLRALHAMITTHGVPLSLYRDRHSIFQRNDSHWTLAEQLAGKQAPTQLGRALEELGIEQIPAYSPKPRAASNAPGALARTPGQRTSPRPGFHFAPGQRRARPLLRRLQPALRPSRRRIRSRLPLPAAPLRSRPLPGLALSTRRRWPITPSPLGANSIALPPLPGHSRLCRRNGRARASLGWQRVYRGDQFLLALPLPLQEYAERRPKLLTSAQKRKSGPDASHLQFSLRPPGFSGRYLIRRGAARIISGG
jgi:hypothetical protein